MVTALLLAPKVIPRMPKGRNEEIFSMMSQSNIILPREMERNHVTIERQEKWSRHGEIYFCKNVDADSGDILPLFSSKSLFRHAFETPKK